uniref:RNA polymerase subunit 6 n=1 Tax=Marseillevirus LCMAC102 TaxID=2506603 RepID=A0A481YU42_9VIRU|nr:MAG: RNA polymerase subunit 6 [Marseillevirus LCMAC102]
MEIEIYEETGEEVFSLPEYLTKYEYTKVIAARGVQLAAGSLPKVNIKNNYDVLDIARRELHDRVISLVIKRKFPDGHFEVFSVKNMNIRDY